MGDTYSLEVLPERMRTKIVVTDDCWIWTGARNKKGYGSTSAGVKNKSMLAHRAAYVAAKGEISPGLEVDHLCENPPCVNPAHLEAVTPAEHARRIGHKDLKPLYRAERAVCASGTAFAGLMETINANRLRYEAMSGDERAEHDRRLHRLHVATNSRCHCEVLTG